MTTLQTTTLGQSLKTTTAYNAGGTWMREHGGVTFGGAAINSAIGGGTKATDTSECIKIDTYRSFSMFSDTYTDYLYMWDVKQEIIVSVVLAETFSISTRLSEFDNHLWACENTIRLAAKYCRTRQYEDEKYRVSVQDLVDSCRAKKGAPVIVVRGRKVAKGTQSTIQELRFGNFGWSAKLSTGEWTAVTNLAPNILKPVDERLGFYYDRREQYFMDSLK